MKAWVPWHNHGLIALFKQSLCITYVFPGLINVKGFNLFIFLSWLSELQN